MTVANDNDVASVAQYELLRLHLAMVAALIERGVSARQALALVLLINEEAERELSRD